MKRKQAEDEGGALWRRGSLLGKGTFGSVYMAELRNTNVRSSFYPPSMAVKCAEISVSTSLQNEKQVFNHLCDCPFVLKCYGEEITFDSGGKMFYNLLLEYASGGTLSSFIRKSSGLPESVVKGYTRSLLKGVDYIHNSGFVHCDLKPENVLLVATRNGKFTPKIADFGLAKNCRRNKRRKLDSFIAGTPLYMAPETLRDNIQEAPSDIWAIGCIVFEMLTGKNLWDPESDAKTDEIIVKIADKLELPKIPCWISKEAKDFLKGCLVKNPMYRFTAEMLLNHPFLSESVQTVKRRKFGEVVDEICLRKDRCWSSSSEYWEESESQGFCAAPISAVTDDCVYSVIKV